MGDNYVKDEFRRHKGANTDQTIAFMEEWAVSFGCPFRCGLLLIPGAQHPKRNESYENYYSDQKVTGHRICHKLVTLSFPTAKVTSNPLPNVKSYH